MARRKAPGKPKRSLKSRIGHACVACGAVVAAGMLICADCVVKAGPAPAVPRPATVVKVSLAPQVGSGYYAPGVPGLSPLGRPENQDQPEPEGTTWPGGVLGGTAVAALAT